VARKHLATQQQFIFFKEVIPTMGMVVEQAGDAPFG
jgi:hypothetical protein